MRLVLASASPRRAELLAAAGLACEVSPADVDETPHVAEPPEEYALRVARDKATAVARRQHAGSPAILAADTVVVSGAGQILGKPADRAEARAMLKTLSGDVHKVHTAVVLHTSDHVLAELVTTRVRFTSLSDSEIEWYVQTGEPDGKAGAYAIQGRASRFIEWIEGSWSNVVGLPVATVYRMLKHAGVLS
jgi:septum formation protein